MENFIPNGYSLATLYVVENRILQCEGSSFHCNVRGQVTSLTFSHSPVPCFVTCTANKACMLKVGLNAFLGDSVLARSKFLGSILKKWIKVNSV